MGRRLVLVMMPSALAAAVSGAPRQVLLSNRLYQGDRYELSIRVAGHGSGRTLEDGVVVESWSGANSRDQRCVDTILAVDPDGRRSLVRRSYSRAVTSSRQTGGKARLSTRPMQGRAFTVSGTSSDPVVSSARGLTDGDIEDVQAALRDDVEILVNPGMHSVGDTWEIPQRFITSFNYRATGQGTCRLEGIEGVGGEERARIALRARIATVSASGRSGDIQLTGLLVWSLPLHRVLSYRYGGPTTTLTTSRQGAVVTRAEAEGTISIAATLTWKAVAGKPVAAPPKRPTGASPSG